MKNIWNQSQIVFLYRRINKIFNVNTIQYILLVYVWWLSIVVLLTYRLNIYILFVCAI